MSYGDIRPIFEAKFNSNVAFLLKTKEQIEEDENRALQRLNETPVERVAKRRKLDEEASMDLMSLYQRPFDLDLPTLMWVRHGELRTTCYVVSEPALKPSTDLTSLYQEPFAFGLANSYVGRNCRSSKQRVEDSNLEEQSHPVVTMADNRTMAEMLRAPTEVYAEAIVVPSILAKQFELKHSLINMMIMDQFFGLERDNPHDHIRWFNKITSTIKYRDVPNSAIKLILFPFSLTGAARWWLEKEPPRSITTWEDFVSKFINELFPPSRTTSLRNEISNFQQRFDESFHEAWDRYKDLLRACPHHSFTELHQLDTFYNALNPADQNSLNAAAGGNLLERSTQDVLTIIENKSKDHRLTRDQSSNPTSSTNTNPKGHNHRSSKQRVKDSNLEEQSHPVVMMADNRTMAEMLRAPTEGYAKAIVVPLILAE
nr:reverse transcriptase domain-containing protein [Tanacetum cinerariifolium]